jgi:iron complex outermembrane receptor protein
MTKQSDTRIGFSGGSLMAGGAKFSILGASMAALSAALFAMPAIAQDAGVPAAEAPEEDVTNRLGTVTVTARKVEENLQDVPVSVTAFTGELLAEKGVVEVADIAAFTPGFTTREANSNSTALVFSLRGQLQNDVLATLDPSVGTYVDDVYWSRAYGLNFNLLDMESVQVLKGPQGTLFGRNTTGGALVFTSAKPDASGFSAKGTVTLGNLNAQVYEGMVNLPILSDKLAVRAAVRQSTRDGYTTDLITGEEYNDRDVTNGRLKVLFAPTDDLELILSAEVYDEDMNGPGYGTIFATGLSGAFLGGFSPVPPVGPIAVAVPGYTGVVNASGGDSVAIDGNPFLTATSQTYSGVLNWDVGPGTLKLIAGDRRISSRTRTDLDGFAFPAGAGDSLHITTSVQDLSQSSFEAQYTGTGMNDKLQYVVGATWFEETGIDATLTDLRVVPNPVILRFFGDVDNTSIGIYGQGTYDLSDRLRATVGVRYSEDEKGITTFNGNSIRDTSTFVSCSGGQAPPNCAESYSDKYDDVSYTLGLDFKPTENTLLYGKFSHGYRSGGQNLRLNGTADLDFDPETVDEFEAGFKGDLLDNRVRLNLAAFTNTVKDAQRSIIVVVGAGNATVVQNAAEMSNSGVELEATVIPADGWTLQASAAVIDTSYDSYVDAGVDVSDRHIIGVPESEFALAATYERSLSFANFLARLDYAWRDSYFNNELAPSSPASTAALQDAITAPASDVLNARLGLSFENGWDISVWGRNVLDDRSKLTGLYLGNFGYVSGRFREPATYGVTASYKFGAD